MSFPLLTRYADMVSFDREGGVVTLLDWRRYPHTTEFIDCTELDEVIAAAEAIARYGKSPLPYVAGYGLALVAYQRRDWPTESKRAALIQAAATLRAALPGALRTHAFLEQALHVADLALLRGEYAMYALIELIETEMAHSDAVAEACGRRAIALLHADACLLVHGYLGPALNWMLHAACIEQMLPLRLYVTESRPSLQGSRLTAHQARTIGADVTLITDNMPGLYFKQQRFTAYLGAAEHIARDGSMSASVGTYQYAVLAAHHNVPFYVLGYEGTDLSFATGADIQIGQQSPEDVLHLAGIRIAAQGIPALASPCDITPPDLITTIVTEHGSFTPDQMADQATLST
jgi:methylthioribose-1-phosphate isomerase